MHYMDTMLKAKEAKLHYMKGKAQTVIAQELGIDYVTLWRWLRIAGITKEEKRIHQIKRMGQVISELELQIDDHDCHKGKGGEDGCECDRLRERIISLKRQLAAWKGGEA